MRETTPPQYRRHVNRKKYGVEIYDRKLILANKKGNRKKNRLHGLILHRWPTDGRSTRA